MTHFKVTPRAVRSLDDELLETLTCIAQQEPQRRTEFWRKALDVLRAEKARRTQVCGVDGCSVVSWCDHCLHCIQHCLCKPGSQ